MKRKTYSLNIFRDTEESNKASTLTTMHTWPCALVAETVQYFTEQGRHSGEFHGTKVVGALRSSMHKDQHGCIVLQEKAMVEEKPICIAGKAIGRGEKSDCHGLGVNEDISFTLTSADRHAVTDTGPVYKVRRLTPIECERLQGFPDNYTNISYRNKPSAPDTLRYKALGNSFAVPVVRWIGERIQKVEDESNREPCEPQ